MHIRSPWRSSLLPRTCLGGARGTLTVAVVPINHRDVDDGKMTRTRPSPPSEAAVQRSQRPPPA